MPMVRNYEDFFFGSCRPSSAITFCRSFQTSGFGRRIAQQIGWVIRGQQLAPAPLLPFTAILRNAARGLQQRFRRHRAQANNHFRIDRINLAQQVWRAGLHFVRLWRAIFRRTAFHYVADVHIFSLQAHRLNHLRQKFPGASHERQALRVFIRSRPFADKHQLSFCAAVAEHKLVSFLMQLAARAVAEVLANLQQRIVLHLVDRFE